jgi:hypothetical protein
VRDEADAALRQAVSLRLQDRLDQSARYLSMKQYFPLGGKETVAPWEGRLDGQFGIDFGVGHINYSFTLLIIFQG